MRRILLLFTAAAMMAVVLGMSAAPASAQDWSSWNWDPDSSPWWWHHDDDRFDDDDFGDFGPDFADQELESGDISTETDISIDGNNNNQCVGALQFGQTGNFANQQGTFEFGDDNGFRFRGHPWWWDRDNHWNWWFDDDDNDWFGHGNGDNEFRGPETTFAPENETGCDQAVQQSAAASSTWDW